ncbi:T9SS type A sorting domain-containing protein [Marixanthomonas sp. SCSIO 43207]|uniref:T9SS type A sorting domain-containing protein n=1 Tax=Marixanthomonas sp. SCSIO 43207 TaxID=2779360 RepID=UPI001CA7F3A5|nr:T9SS type A sorting domain-containing protein [Marixanthomonas sp. SCSIO 43207]UAB80497.1 T9SS type A sorting domain-containing protein [Marixanthomonas sp. SCSIO 43207]
MKHLLLSLLVLSSITVTAQADLFVRPNPSNNSDSYVYVNDVVLYVEDNVNLERNTNNPDTEASIYLRNNGQLLQGNDAAYNSGTGMLSVYQQIDSTSAFHYNYWGMPVGIAPNSNAENTSSGVAVVYDCDGCGDRDTAATQSNRTTGRNGYEGNPMTISTRWIYALLPSPYREDEAVWRRMNSNQAPGEGLGFIMKGISPNPITGNTGDLTDLKTDVIYDLRGRPKTGTIQINMGPGDEIVLSGNPYPSVLDLRELYYDNNTLGSAGIASFQFWDEPKGDEFSHFYSDKSGGYGVYTPASNTYAPATFANYSASGVGSNTPFGGASYINQQFTPIGQGFIIVTDGTAGTIEFNNSQRVFRSKSATEVFHRPIQNDSGNIENENLESKYATDSNGAVITENDDRAPHLRINVVMEAKYGRQLVLGFDDNTSLGFDLGWDGKSPMDAKNGEAYFLIGDDNDRQPYVINFLNYSSDNEIPIGFKLTKQTKLSINTVEAVKMQGRKAYIFDSEQKTFQEFTNGRSATFNLPAGTYDNRFFVVFQDEKESLNTIKEIQGRTAETVEFYQNNRLGVLEVSNPEGYDIKQALVFDMTGKLVFEKANIGTEKSFSFPTSNLSDGVYLVKLQTVDNVDISYKTSVYNKN